MPCPKAPVAPRDPELPPVRAYSPPSKRKANPDAQEFAGKSAPSPARKKQRIEDKGDGEPPEERYKIVDRRFYPAQMSSERCHAYSNGEILQPLAELERVLKETSKERAKIEVKDAVVHYFKMDLRVKDNKGLYMAREKAKSKGVPLIGVYLVSPQDFEAHIVAPVRVDFILRNVTLLQEDLAALDIPLYVELVPKRKNVVPRLLDLCEEWGASHVFANMEYEVDELRRETKLVKKGLERGFHCTAIHDTCTVAPGRLQTGTGNQYAVYSPWFRAWVKHIHANPSLLDLYPAPTKNPTTAREKFGKLFDSPVPDPSHEDSLKSKRMTDEEKKRYHHLWPAGEAEAQSRLAKFLETRINKYSEMRNNPGANATAVLSCHFAAGTVSSRTCIRAARDRNSSKSLDAGNKGIMGWVSEVAWRDFYKHVLAHWPYVCMNKPFKPEYTDIEWDYDDEKFGAWCEGRTGYPIVDAAMRQMRHMGYMHNRCRMIAASFLCKDLLQDWRMGERFFMENLIDGDFASNNGGWGFSASSGVDPQPYFRIFNPLLQSEKFDPDGEYIRKWVPELKDVKGKAIHDPWGRGASKIARQNGYPHPIVEHASARKAALDMYKRGLGKDST